MSTFDWFGDRPDELPDHETIIPIDLMFGEAMEAPGGAKPPPAPTIPTLEEPPEAVPTGPMVVDAGVVEQPDAATTSDASTEAGEPDAAEDGGARDATIERDADEQMNLDAAPSTEAGIEPRLPSPDAGIARTSPEDAAPALVLPDATVASADAASGRGDAGFTPIRDPVDTSGDIQKIAPKNPNVSLLMYPERIRNHKLAVQFAPTLTKLRNWRRFFGGTGLDPVRDADWILLAGPQLRDSSRVVAVLRYNVPQHQVRAAIDSLVRQSGGRGQWVPKPVPVAKAHVDGAERYFVMTGPNTLVVVPPDGLEQALKLPRNLRFPTRGNEAVVLYLKHPANAFRDQPVKLPTSVQWMRFSLTLSPGGGADARLEAKDQDPATAAKNAPELTEVINKAMVIDLLFTKRRLLDPVTFRAEGDRIRTETHVTDAQLRHILSFMAARIEQVDGPGLRAPSPTRSASPAASDKRGL